VSAVDRKRRLSSDAPQDCHIDRRLPPADESVGAGGPGHRAAAKPCDLELTTARRSGGHVRPLKDRDFLVHAGIGSNRSPAAPADAVFTNVSLNMERRCQRNVWEISIRRWSCIRLLGYVLTGEHRPYDRKVAYARRILPQRTWGAVEVVGRYSHVDLDDRLVDGGIFDRATVGINWWATRRWKIGFDYGLINLDRMGISGATHAFHTRFQWAY
jgi:hypothetical protein